MAPYDTVTLSSGRTFRSSERDLSNTIIDAQGERLSLVIDSDGEWSNVAVVGRPRFDRHLIDVRPGEKQFTLDRYYIGPSASGGSHDSGRRDHAGVFVHPYHEGDVYFKNGLMTGVYQAYYCSNSGNPPGDEPQRLPGAGGDVHFENCYTSAFTHTAYRIGTEGSTIRGCVAADPVPARGGGDGSQRSVWVYQTGGEVRDSDFETDVVVGGLYDRDPNPVIDECRGTGSNRIYGGRYRGSGLADGADLSIPDGVPRSPRDAASGSGGSGDSQGESGSGADVTGPPWRHVVIDATDTETGISYELDCSASDVVEGEYADPQEVIDGRIVRGEANGGIDDVYARSEDAPHLNSAVVRGPPEDCRRVRVTVDGEPYDFDAESTTGFEHDVVIDGSRRTDGNDSGGGGAVDYWIVVSGDAQQHSRGACSIQADDGVVELPSGDRVLSGSVGRGVDGYDFDGEVRHVGLESGEGVVVAVDGERID